MESREERVRTKNGLDYTTTQMGASIHSPLGLHIPPPSPLKAGIDSKGDLHSGAEGHSRAAWRNGLLHLLLAQPRDCLLFESLREWPAKAAAPSRLHFRVDTTGISTFARGILPR